MLSDTRVSIRLTLGCQTSYTFMEKNVMDAIEEIFIGYIFFHLVECKSHFLFFLKPQQFVAYLFQWEDKCFLIPNAVFTQAFLIVNYTDSSFQTFL